MAAPQIASAAHLSTTAQALLPAPFFTPLWLSLRRPLPGDFPLASPFPEVSFPLPPAPYDISKAGQKLSPPPRGPKGAYKEATGCKVLSPWPPGCGMLRGVVAQEVKGVRPPCHHLYPSAPSVWCLSPEAGVSGGGGPACPSPGSAVKSGKVLGGGYTQLLVAGWPGGVDLSWVTTAPHVAMAMVGLPGNSSSSGLLHLWGVVH